MTNIIALLRDALIVGHKEQTSRIEGKQA